jgi:hypothetical protein
MGIVSYCPNGHRVKVKDFQAGRRGLCPTCGAKFRIPAASTGPGAPETARPAAAGSPLEPELPLARFVPLDPAAVGTLPRALPFGSARAAALAAATALEQHKADNIQERERPFESEPVAPEEFASATSPPLHPAIADRPNLSWRIAYPGGEPSEPVDAVTMQEWLAGGLAEGNELVWRADWADWLPVRDVFAEFFPGA